MRWSLVVLLLALVAPLGHGQQERAEGGRHRSEFARLGLQLGEIPKILYVHLPQLKEGQGLLIRRVTSGSAAAALGVKAHDILISFDEEPLHDYAHFVKLLNSAEEKKARLRVLRRGKAVAFSLPVATFQARLREIPKATSKSQGPPAVTVEAKPLENGRFDVVFHYYPNGSGKLERFSFSGSISEIKQALHEQKGLPARVHELIGVALDRMKSLHLNDGK